MTEHDEAARLRLIEACCIAAAQTGFPHLAVKDIIAPPRRWFDAKLARQVAIFLMVDFFKVPRRRVTTMQGRQRTSISFALQTIDRRRQSPLFAEALDRMAAHARARYEQEIPPSCRNFAEAAPNRQLDGLLGARDRPGNCVDFTHIIARPMPSP